MKIDESKFCDEFQSDTLMRLPRRVAIEFLHQIVDGADWDGE